jgi:hypothetical protein
VRGLSAAGGKSLMTEAHLLISEMAWRSKMQGTRNGVSGGDGIMLSAVKDHPSGRISTKLEMTKSEVPRWKESTLRTFRHSSFDFPSPFVILNSSFARSHAAPHLSSLDR